MPTLNMIFSVTYYSELHVAIHFYLTVDVLFYQVTMLMFV